MNASRTQKKELSVLQGLTRVALMIFFIATVGVGASFLEGDRVASVSGDSQISSALPPGFGNARTQQYLVSSCSFWDLWCNQYKGRTYYAVSDPFTRQEVRYYPATVNDQERYFVGHGCTPGGSCESNSEMRYGDPRLQELLGSIARPTAGDGDVSEPPATGDTRDEDARREAGACLNGEGENCRNFCETTYVTIEPHPGGTDETVPEVNSCFMENQRTEGSGMYLIRQLRLCMLSNGISADGLDQRKLVSALCMTNQPPPVTYREIAEGADAPAEERTVTSRKLLVPQACKRIVDQIEALKKAPPKEATATQADADRCAWKGAAICYPKNLRSGSLLDRARTAVTGAVSRVTRTETNSRDTEYVCEARRGATPSLANPAQALQACLKQAGSDAQKQLECRTKHQPRNPNLGGSRNNPGPSGPSGGLQPFGGQNPFGMMPMLPKMMMPKMMPKPPSSGSNPCPSGYELTTQDSKRVCKKKADSAQPACLFVANKNTIAPGETALLRWRTANAQSVSITNLTETDVNGQTTVQPSKTTTYTLTATGEGDSTKTCDLTLTVDGEPTGASGAAPKLSCTPDTIEKGDRAEVKWACTTRAKTAVSDDFTTNNQPSGSVTVRPEHNTQYEVSCKDGDAVIGTNTCAVKVGEPLADIIVTPQTAQRGDRVRVSWASLFMKQCSVKGPRAFDYTRTQGVVITEPFALTDDPAPERDIRAAIYSLKCESVFGGVEERDVTVRFVE